LRKKQKNDVLSLHVSTAVSSGSKERFIEHMSAILKASGSTSWDLKRTRGSGASACVVWFVCGGS
jgi:hypothetical protein